MRDSMSKNIIFLVLAVIVAFGVRVSVAQQSSTDSSTILQPVIRLHITLDMRQGFFNGQRPDSIIVLKGNQARSGLQDVSSGLQMHNNGDNTWQASTNLAYGDPADLPFAFVWHIMDGWHRESLAGRRVHLAWLGGNQNEVWVRMHYDPREARVLPDSTSGGLVDQYQSIMSKLGDQTRKNTYYYDAAVQSMESGNLETADNEYEHFQNTAANEVWDEYVSQKARYLAKHNKLPQALALCDELLKNDSLSEQQAQMLYTKGTLLDEHGQAIQARGIYNQVVNKFSGQKGIVSDAQLSLGLSYIREKQADSVRKGVGILQNLLGEVKQARRQRWIIHSMIRHDTGISGYRRYQCCYTYQANAYSSRHPGTTDTEWFPSSRTGSGQADLSTGHGSL